MWNVGTYLHRFDSGPRDLDGGGDMRHNLGLEGPVGYPILLRGWLWLGRRAAEMNHPENAGKMVDLVVWELNRKARLCVLGFVRRIAFISC